MYLDELYVGGEKCYTEASKWLLKLLIGFYKKYHMMGIMYNSSLINRKRYIDFGCNIKNAKWVDSITMFFEPRLLLYSYGTDKDKPHEAHRRLQLWRFFLIDHNKEIPKIYRDNGLHTLDLLEKIRSDGTRNDKKLKELFNLYINFEDE